MGRSQRRGAGPVDHEAEKSRLDRILKAVPVEFAAKLNAELEVVERPRETNVGMFFYRNFTAFRPMALEVIRRKAGLPERRIERVGDIGGTDDDYLAA